jgi:hypothetical protein
MTVAILLVPPIGGTFGYLLYSRFDLGLGRDADRTVQSDAGPIGPNTADDTGASDAGSDPAITAPAPTTTPPTTVAPPDADVDTRYSLVYTEPPPDGGSFEITLTVGNTGSVPITIAGSDLVLEADGRRLSPTGPAPGAVTVPPNDFAAIPVTFDVPAGAQRLELVIGTGDARTSDRITVTL